MTTYTTSTFGNGREHDFLFEHNLGSEDIDVVAYENNGQLVMLNSTPVTRDAVRVTFWGAPRRGELTLEVRAL